MDRRQLRSAVPYTGLDFSTLGKEDFFGTVIINASFRFG